MDARLGIAEDPGELRNGRSSPTRGAGPKSVACNLLPFGSSP
jgi:hypothetical protein